MPQGGEILPPPLMESSLREDRGDISKCQDGELIQAQWQME